MLSERILDFLRRKDDYVSGEELAGRLGISRQALWKYTHQLKEAGYEIVAVPHLGYRLISPPDKLLPCEVTFQLQTKFLAKKVHYFERLTSTMDMGMELGMQGAAEGTVVLAEAQTKGRGRLGRSWFSPKYKGIYLSLLLRPKILPTQTPLLTLLSGVSVCEAIQGVTALDARLKWPNDIFIQHKKLGGILTELAAETDVTAFVVIGIGLNVNNEKKDLVAGATSLKELKRQKINRRELLQELLRRIEANYLSFQEKGATIILDKWRNFNLTLGKRVKVILPKAQLEGEALDIDSDGGLLLRKDSGLIEKVMAGDIVH